MSTITSNSLFSADNSITPAPASTTTSGSSASDPTSTESLTSEDTFLKLLVAQIQNQDPTNPTDATQFVGQLTQYSELEQLIQINGNVKSLGQTPAPTATPTNSTNPITQP